MKIDRDALGEPAPHVVRVASDELLARVRDKFDGLQTAEKTDALHDFRVAVRRLRSWLRDFDDELRDTLKRKQPRRLGRIADATRDSRDLEVHIEWVDAFGRGARRQHKAGIKWLRGRLTARKARADLALRRSLDDEFGRATTALSKALRRYTVKVDERPRPFASAVAALVRSRGVAARDALARVRSIGDRVEGHEARIAAKRLRYLLEPVAECVDGAMAVVDQLTELQDALGALHDAQLFGSDIARALAKVLASSEGDASGDDNGDRAPGLLAISRRLRRDEEKAFKHIESRWLHDGARSLWAEVEAVAERLDAIGKEGREVERKYLLTAMPADAPAGEVLEIDQGYLPGDRLVERVRRVRTGDGTEYSRTIKVGRGLERHELEDKTTEHVFKTLWPLTKGHRIEKRRHRIADDGHVWELDEFVDRALILAEVEIDHGETVAPPKWLEPVIDHDVTDDDAYRNQSLAH